jgi:hypothetical protein
MSIYTQQNEEGINMNTRTFTKIRPAPYYVLAVQYAGKPWIIEFGSHAIHEVMEEKGSIDCEPGTYQCSTHRIPSASEDDQFALLVRLNREC